MKPRFVILIEGISGSWTKRARRANLDTAIRWAERHAQVFLIRDLKTGDEWKREYTGETKYLGKLT